MKLKYLLSLLIIPSLFNIQQVGAQENIREFLVLGVEVAEEITSGYTQPAAEGLMYGLTGGWYNSAQVRDKWQVEISIVTNGAFVPEDARNYSIDTNDFDDLTTTNGEAVLELPTILGSSDATATFVANVNGELYQFESPEGLGLADLNFLPNAFIQAKVGLPKATEAGIRFVPKITFEDVSVGLFGLGLQHEFSRWIPALNTSPFAVSAFVAYTRLFADYNFQTGGDIIGENQEIDMRMNAWLFEVVGSTKFPKLNFYGGMGFVLADANTDMLGTYTFDVSGTPLTVTDPFDFQNEVDGFRANIGVALRLGWFGINGAYTFQGYNNFSLALNFNIR